MLLSVKDRILLFTLLPSEGDILSLRTVRKLREDLAFSDDENRELKIQQTGPSYHWDPAADKLKEVELSGIAQAIIKNALKRMNENKSLTVDHIDLWDKVIPNGEG